MVTATFNKFQQFAEDLWKGVHQFHAAGHTFRVYLTDATPSASADAVKADLAEIANEHGYTGPADIQNDMSEADGIVTLTGADVVITADGGTVGPFRYAVIYNDTPVSPADPLMGWVDYGSEITLQDGESLTIDIGAALGTFS